MPPVRQELRFLLNDEAIALADVHHDETLLDFLRLRKSLRGSKEGCAEGDCGACTVLVGRLSQGELVYESVTACIRFVGSLDGCHVVTIEHLAGRDGALHPVQQAMVDHHGSQCGFCTPGIVMALYALWMRDPNPTVAQIERALQGNLCRCTGYEPIVKAARAISGYGQVEADVLWVERERVIAALSAMRDGSRVEIGSGDARLIVPTDTDDLAALYAAEPKATLVAGSTDVGLWVTKFMRPIGPAIFTSHLDPLRAIDERDGAIIIGAGVSYTDAYRALGKRIPALGGLIERIGGEQIRNMGTLGGNIANGSPIGDTPPPLIALGAEITLRRGNNRRTVPLEAFFVAYGKQDRQPGEFVESIRVPLPDPSALFAVHKITKRRDEDITATLGAFHVMVENGRVQFARIAYGGMAATPKRAAAVEGALTGKAWTEATIDAALPAFERDFQPISDMRASAEYRMLVAKNLLRRFFLETTQSQPVQVSRLEAAE